ncbi:MAG TPA: hypothetical protein VJ505_06240 [Holophagaceae bacterium]|nr:hypothetical protein [Holophagaceae bacterium]
MTTVHVEVWRDEHGVEWELVQMGLDEIGGSCVIRERNRLDEIDGDHREGFDVIARFGDREAAEDYLRDEGFYLD